ncbi:MAG: hypothetical protein NT173_05870 [Opitutales bacterium]|nr:hypothetical protein [Opitutales bacterium]
MSRSRFHPWLPALLLAATAAGLPAATPVIGTQLFQETNARIDDLFEHRNKPPKPPGPQDNPFRLTDLVAAPELPGATDAQGNAMPDTGPRETPDEALLRQAYGNLTFGGLLQVGDRRMVVINKSTYREGSLLTVRVRGADVYLRILSLTKDSITLGLQEARLTLHF